MSASDVTATPHLPTSPSASGWSGSRPISVGRSKATERPWLPCSSRYLKRALVSRGAAEAGELAHRPELAAVHRLVDAARVRELAGVAEVALVVEPGHVRRGRRAARSGRPEIVVNGRGRSAPAAFASSGPCSSTAFVLIAHPPTPRHSSARWSSMLGPARVDRPLPGVLACATSAACGPGAPPGRGRGQAVELLRHASAVGCGARSPSAPCAHQLRRAAAVRGGDHGLARAERLQRDEAVVLVPGREVDGAAARVVVDELRVARPRPAARRGPRGPARAIALAQAGPVLALPRRS